MAKPRSVEKEIQDLQRNLAAISNGQAVFKYIQDDWYLINMEIIPHDGPYRGAKMLFLIDFTQSSSETVPKPNVNILDYDYVLYVRVNLPSDCQPCMILDNVVKGLLLLLKSPNGQEEEEVGDEAQQVSEGLPVNVKEPPNKPSFSPLAVLQTIQCIFSRVKTYLKGLCEALKNRFRSRKNDVTEQVGNAADDINDKKSKNDVEITDTEAVIDSDNDNDDDGDDSDNDADTDDSDDTDDDSDDYTDDDSDNDADTDDSDDNDADTDDSDDTDDDNDDTDDDSDNESVNDIDTESLFHSLDSNSELDAIQQRDTLAFHDGPNWSILRLPPGSCVEIHDGNVRQGLCELQL